MQISSPCQSRRFIYVIRVFFVKLWVCAPAAAISHEYEYEYDGVTCDGEIICVGTFRFVQIDKKSSSRSRDNLVPLTEILSSLKPSEFTDFQLARYKVLLSL